MKKWNMIIDVANCTNCNVCTLSVQDEHVGNAFEGYAEEMPKHGHRWINIERRERGSAPATDVAYLPTMCQHCDDAPCQKAAPDAVTKRDDGIVIIDPVKSKGRREIYDACPFGAVWWNEEKDIPQHWIFDAHLLDKGWKEPRCETSCATRAFRSVKLTDEEMAKIAQEEGWKDAPKAMVLIRAFSIRICGGLIVILSQALCQQNKMVLSTVSPVQQPRL